MYWICTKPEGWIVCRKRSDFDWLAQLAKISNSFTVESKADIDTLLASINADQAAFSIPAVQFFLSCSNDKSFNQRKKRECKNAKGETPGDKAVNEFVTDLEISARQVKSGVKDLKGLLEDTCFIVEQLGVKLKKVGETFGKLNEAWKNLEKHKVAAFSSTMEATTGPKLSEMAMELKLGFFQWSNSVENHKKLLKKSFVIPAEKIVSTFKDLRKNLKIRREAEDHQLNVANEIVMAEFVKCAALLRKEVSNWISTLVKVAPYQEAMENIIRSHK